MSTSTQHLSEQVKSYVREVALAGESETLARLRTKTAELDNHFMQISVEQGQMMALFTKAMGVRRAIEVGVFTGYSALCVAAALPEDGRLVACDISEEWTAIGRDFWVEAGVADRIDLRIGPANETLAAMIENGEAGQYDLAFIDANKLGYDEYYEQALTLLRAGGVILFDNMLWGGKAAKPPEGDEVSAAIHDLTAKVMTDERVEHSLVPIGDGVLMVRKR